MLLRDAAFGIDEHRDGNAPQRAERILHVVAAVADKDRIIHLHLHGVWLQLFDWIVNRDPENDDVLPFRAILRLQLDERWDLGAARATPRRPEVDDNRLAFERSELHVD